MQHKCVLMQRYVRTHATLCTDATLHEYALRLKAYCKQEGRTMTAVMQNAVDELLKEAENEDR